MLFPLLSLFQLLYFPKSFCTFFEPMALYNDIADNMDMRKREGPKPHSGL